MKEGEADAGLKFDTPWEAFIQVAKNSWGPFPSVPLLLFVYLGLYLCVGSFKRNVRWNGRPAGSLLMNMNPTKWSSNFSLLSHANFRHWSIYFKTKIIQKHIQFPNLISQSFWMNFIFLKSPVSSKWNEIRNTAILFDFAIVFCPETQSLPPSPHLNINITICPFTILHNLKRVKKGGDKRPQGGWGFSREGIFIWILWRMKCNVMSFTLRRRRDSRFQKRKNLDQLLRPISSFRKNESL